MNDIVDKPSTEIVAIENADELTRIVTKALHQMEEILDMEIPEKAEAKDRARVLSIKKDAAASIITAGLKADENRFRKEQKDIIDRLFKKIEKSGKIVDGTIKK